MKQIFRRVLDRKGKIVVQEVPVPAFGRGEILVANKFSLISSGTEASTVKKTPIELTKQALSDPWMRNAIKKVVLGGSFSNTANIIFQELTMLRALGYSSAGVVINKGADVRGIEIGDHVACAGTNNANHAEVIRVPHNLCVKVSKSVDLKDAAFIRVAAIGMHGLRRAKLEFGEKVGIIGLGLLGQLTAQVALAAGMDVYGFDVDQSRLDLAASCGVRNLINSSEGHDVETAMTMTDGLGIDAVIICAASKDKSIANNAMKMCRKQGRVVAIGIVKMDLERMPFFVNELDFRFSRGHGPGARDDNYEVKGIDYPYGYVRWTEKRNMEEVARLMAEKKITVSDLVGEVFSIDQASEAYRKILAGEIKSVASVIQYDDTSAIAAETTITVPTSKHAPDGTIRLGLIGCGNFVRTTHLPNLKKNQAFCVKAVASATGINATSFAKANGIERITSNYAELISDPDIDAVVVATRHHQHATIAIEAANAGKHVFMEKPMAMTLDDFSTVGRAVKENDVAFMVGYNRRFSPMAKKAKQICGPGPIVVEYQVNVGKIPADHWTLDPIEGGGRLLGESDHFFDMFCFLTNSVPARVYSQCIMGPDQTPQTQYNFVVVVTFADGSICTLVYTGLGSTLAPKETVRIFSGGQICTITDYREIEIVGARKHRKKGSPDKGHSAEWDHFEQLIRGNADTTIPYAPVCALQALESLSTGKAIGIDLHSF